MNGDVFVHIIITVATLIGALVTAYLIPWIDCKLGAEKMALLTSYVTLGVRCAEQIFTSDQWKEKKIYVMNYIRDIIDEKLHVDLTEEQIDAIVEGIVNEVKHGGTAE